MPEKALTKIDKLIAIIIKGVVFLLPLFFLPWTGEFFEFNKQFLLWLAMPAALFLWLVKQARQGQLKLKTNPLNLPIIIFLALALTASFFGQDKFSSFFGQFGRFSHAWLGLLSLVIFYFLLVNSEIAASAEKIMALLKLWLYAAIIAAVVALSAIPGLFGALIKQPFSILAASSFNPAGGSILSLAIFLAVASVALLNFLCFGDLKKFERMFFGAGLIIFFLVLLFINFYLSWVMLLAGAGLTLFFHWAKSGFNFKRIFNYALLIPAVIMAAAIFFLAYPRFSPAKVILGADLPREAVLPYGQSLTITKEALKRNWALGSGLGTFSQDFSRYRPAELNRSVFWQIRFDQSGSHFLEILATAGLPALVSYFLIISLTIFINASLLRKHLKSGQPFLENKEYNLAVSLLVMFTALAAAQIFFPANTVLTFSFWLALGLSAAFWQTHNQTLFKEKIFKLSAKLKFFRPGLVMLFLAAAGWTTLAVFEVKFFAADIIAASGNDRQASLHASVKLNPSRYNYAVSLAKFYLNRAKAEAAKPEGKRDNRQVQLNITGAIELARRAAATAPNSVLTWEILGMIYRDVRLLTIGSEPWAAQAFKRALELEPTNPVLATELAKAYLNDNNAAEAEKYFSLALRLKPDYYEAEFGLAKAYLKEKKDDLAFKALNELASKITDPEIYYELGRFYYNHGQLDQAREKFELALRLAPQHANALYSLGIIFEAKGKPKEALKYYKKVLELNPGNAEVEEKIKQLSK